METPLNSNERHRGGGGGDGEALIRGVVCRNRCPAAAVCLECPADPQAPLRPPMHKSWSGPELIWVAGGGGSSSSSTTTATITAVATAVGVHAAAAAAGSSRSWPFAEAARRLRYSFIVDGGDEDGDEDDDAGQHLPTCKGGASGGGSGGGGIAGGRITVSCRGSSAGSGSAAVERGGGAAAAVAVTDEPLKEGGASRSVPAAAGGGTAAGYGGAIAGVAPPPLPAAAAPVVVVASAAAAPCSGTGIMTGVVNSAAYDVPVVCFAGGAHGGSGRRPNGAATATPPLPAEIVAAPPIERLAVVDAAGGTSGSMHGGGGAVRVPVPVAAAAAVGGKPARACGFSEGVCVCGGGLGPPHWPASAWMRCACCVICILYSCDGTTDVGDLRRRPPCQPWGRQQRRCLQCRRVFAAPATAS
ncbi:hypothetical protein CHLRE_04g214505v5 [Chlamydomonas reinhardtii]|uniref:Uncharacterized protein n=1 Tax=Chlamydomonas reinhardtii TaxID=3055 RepID=A0A2K3DTV8_CHLRE|nr:uncharacterized protein CHLRE_04g214505v5 [Chlamydomonas reinhardtii]PNW83952.1 hypothetical protein CHLRE_04g214505v5 [Chlamydomonas reinhardtii]